jgi:hypothetical protein
MERSSRRWKDKLKVGSVNAINAIRDTGERQAVVNIVLKFRVPECAEFLK